MAFRRSTAISFAALFLLVLIARLPPNKVYPHTHLRDALLYGLDTFVIGTLGCTVIQHHRMGRVAAAGRRSDNLCLKIGTGMGMIAAAYNLRHDIPTGGSGFDA